MPLPPITWKRDLDFRGLHARKNISAVARAGERLIVAGDERSFVDVLEPRGDGRYERVHSIQLLPGNAETDLESLTVLGDVVYAIGSHGQVRMKVDPGIEYSVNRELLSQVEEQPTRYKLFRFELGADGKPEEPPDQTSLADVISEDPYLKRFANIPSKENGVDIEAISNDGQNLYVGFRGPVLRGAFAPVLVCSFEDPRTYDLRFVSLRGSGIRDLSRLKKNHFRGFLVLAGPVGEQSGPFEIYRWDGKDCIPGIDCPGGTAVPLGVLETDPGVKPEGMTVLHEGDHHYEVLIVFDGLKQGGPSIWSVPVS